MLYSQRTTSTKKQSPPIEGQQSEIPSFCPPVPKTAVFPGCLAAVAFVTKGLKVALIEEKLRTTLMRFDVIDIGCRRQLSRFEAMLAVGML